MSLEHSRIFTDKELEEIEKRKNGDKSDKTGVFSRRIRPKMEEIVEEWIPRKKELKKLLEKKK